MPNATEHHVLRTGLRATAGGMLLTLMAASLIDLGTSSALRLTDESPSHAVLLFQSVDLWVSPLALGSSAVALVLWLMRSDRPFVRMFDLSLLLALVALVVNVAGLVMSLFDPKDDPGFLLLSAGLVYVENVAVFAAYYWRFDHTHHNLYADGDERDYPGILFPQGTLGFRSLKGWVPRYMDYFFLSFNTSSTFGPTLPVPLRASIQLGMMLQVTIAMTVLLMLAARAVGMIG
jgi:hypothetical protein